jgi:protoheme ferro-lyase
MGGDYMIWILFLLLAILSGISFLKFLTVHPTRMNIHISLVWIFLFGSLILFFRPEIFSQAWLGLLAWGGFFLVGYSFQTKLFLSREDTRTVPLLTRQPDDPGKGHVAVIYFTHGEPETYDPIGWLNQFREFDEQKISFVPFFARPFFVYRLRKSYLKVGMSHHRQTHQRMLRSLEREFRMSGDETTRFYLSFLDDNPRPDAAVIQALNEGASQLIVAEVFVSISNHTLEGKYLINELGLDRFNIPIHYTGPLWDSPTLHQMFVQRVGSRLEDTPKEKVGVLLVGHGQPDEWDREFATETEHELQFRHSIIDLFEQNGYPRENLSMAWMEFKNPKPAQVIEQFVKNGIEKVMYFSAAISADSLHSQFDVPELVHKAHIPRGFPLENLGAWNDDPIVIQAIKNKIDAVALTCIEIRSYVMEFRDEVPSNQNGTV